MLTKHERKAQRMMDRELNDHLALARDVHAFMESVAKSVPAGFLHHVSVSLPVDFTLLSRLTNDLRSLTLMARCGYILQAVSLAASIYETAYTLVYVCGDEQRSVEWSAHNDPTRSFKGVFQLTEAGYKIMGAGDPLAQAQLDYRIYRQLCWAKHANPIMQKMFGHTINPAKKVITFASGPEVTAQAVRAAAFALQHSSRLCYMAAVTFVTVQLPQEMAKLNPSLEELSKRLMTLSKASDDRWRAANPFPDNPKW